MGFWARLKRLFGAKDTGGGVQRPHPGLGDIVEGQEEREARLREQGGTAGNIRPG